MKKQIIIFLGNRYNCLLVGGEIITEIACKSNDNKYKLPENLLIRSLIAFADYTCPKE